MEKKDKLSEYYNLLIIRNHLTLISKSNLIKIYQDLDYYLAFLNTMWLVEENDSAFLLLNDDFLEKILTILQIHRFNKEYPEIQECVNGIIDYINSIKSYSNNLKNTIKNNYLAYQEETRKTVFHSNADLLDSLSYDAVVFSCLYSGRIEDIVQDDNYIRSLNFLLETCPELFEDEEIKKRALLRLEQSNNKCMFLSPKKKILKKIKQSIEKIEKKKE